jgi:hypothetical protein
MSTQYNSSGMFTRIRPLTFVNDTSVTRVVSDSDFCVGGVSDVSE